jgi:chitodextrinase
LDPALKDVTKNPDYSPANCIETNLFVLQGKIFTPAVVPAAPTGLVATGGDAQVSLTWTAATGATSYNVKRSTVSGGPYTTVSTAGAVTGTSFIDTGLTSGTTYFYVVTAANTAGESANSTEASATTQAAADTQAPTVPTGLTATAVSSSQINLSWTAANDNVAVAGYHVYRDGVATAIASVTTGTSFSDSGLTASSSHSYTVDAFDAAGNTSAKSVAASATTQAAPVVGTPVASVNPGTLNFGSVKVGTTSTKAVTLKNTGTAPLNIANVAIGGTNAGNSFTRVTGNATTNCGASLAAGASCTITVAFAPATRAAFSATLTITDNANPTTQTVALSGRAN